MSLMSSRAYAANDFAAIRERQRDLSKPAPIVCTCTSGGRWAPCMSVEGFVLQTLLPDPGCRVHRMRSGP
jgi:hypothetical protein